MFEEGREELSIFISWEWELIKLEVRHFKSKTAPDCMLQFTDVTWSDNLLNLCPYKDKHLWLQHILLVLYSCSCTCYSCHWLYNLIGLKSAQHVHIKKKKNWIGWDSSLHHTAISRSLLTDELLKSHQKSAQLHCEMHICCLMWLFFLICSAHKAHVKLH